MEEDKRADSVYLVVCLSTPDMGGTTSRTHFKVVPPFLCGRVKHGPVVLRNTRVRDNHVKATRLRLDLIDCSLVSRLVAHGELEREELAWMLRRELREGGRGRVPSTAEDEDVWALDQ